MRYPLFFTEELDEMAKLDLVKSKMNGQLYDPMKCVRIVDRLQHDLYMKHGLYPVDMYYSFGKTVYVYDRDSSHDCYIKWRNRELE